MKSGVQTHSEAWKLMKSTLTENFDTNRKDHAEF